MEFWLSRERSECVHHEISDLPGESRKLLRCFEHSLCELKTLILVNEFLLVQLWAR